MKNEWGQDPAIELGPSGDDSMDRADEHVEQSPPVASTAAIASAGDPVTADDRRGTSARDDARDREMRAPEPAPQREPTPERRPREEAMATSGGTSSGSAATPLFDEAATSDLRGRWGDIQAGFVDEPRSAVEHADALVAEVMKRLAEGFAGERSSLEEQWSRGGDVSTEELRVALQRYRSFFDRLLSI